MGVPVDGKQGGDAGGEKPERTVESLETRAGEKKNELQRDDEPGHGLHGRHERAGEDEERQPAEMFMRCLPAEEDRHIERAEEPEGGIHFDVARIVDKEWIHRREKHDEQRAFAIGELSREKIDGRDGQRAKESGKSARGIGRKSISAVVREVFNGKAPPAKHRIPTGREALIGQSGEHEIKGITNSDDRRMFVGPIGLIAEPPESEERGDGGDEREAKPERSGGRELPPAFTEWGASVADRRSRGLRRIIEVRSFGPGARRRIARRNRGIGGYGGLIDHGCSLPSRRLNIPFECWHVTKERRSGGANRG